MAAQYLEETGKPPPKAGRETIALLSEILGPVALRGWPRTDGGRLSTRRAHLKRLADRPAIALLLQFRDRDKLLASKFGRPLIGFVHPVTGRLHGDYQIAEARTGRFTCSKPALQTLPSEVRAPGFRRIIIAPPGDVLVVGDWSQIELRVIAWITGCKPLTAAFAAGRDIHRETAAAITGLAYEAVTEAQRAAAKPVNFGAIYGIGADALAEDAFDSYGVEMTAGEAQHALDRFFAQWPIRDWLNRHAERCQQRGFVEVPTSGRRIAAHWQHTGRLSFPQCCNLSVQGAAADAMLRAIALLNEHLPGTLVGSWHDELLLQVPADEAERAAGLLAEIMIAAFVETFPGAPTRGVVEIGIGQNWHEAKKAAAAPPEPVQRVLQHPGTLAADTRTRMPHRRRRGAAAD